MRRAVVISLAALLPVMALHAHHAPAVFDQSRTIVVEGTVTEFVWANPHSWIRMDVVGDDGTVMEHGDEPADLSRARRLALDNPRARR